MAADYWSAWREGWTWLTRAAALLLPLAFKTSSRREVVGGASAPRVTRRPAHARQGLPAEVPAEAGRVVAGQRRPAYR